MTQLAGAQSRIKGYGTYSRFSPIQCILCISTASSIQERKIGGRLSRPATMPDGGINPVDSIRREPLSKWRENTGWENTCAGKNYGGMTLQGTGGWRGRLPGAPHTARLL